MMCSDFVAKLVKNPHFDECGVELFQAINDLLNSTHCNLHYSSTSVMREPPACA